VALTFDLRDPVTTRIVATMDNGFLAFLPLKCLHGSLRGKWRRFGGDGPGENRGPF
jgi:hypothetical protein